MALTLSPELEERIQRVVKSGRYETTQEALESAVYRLETEDDVLAGWSTAELQAAIDEGLESVEREPLVTSEEARAHLAAVRAELLRG